MDMQEFEFIYKGEKIAIKMNLDDFNDPRTKMIFLTKKNSKILEFGCNTGFCSKVLLDRGCEVVGVEIDPESAEIAKRFCKKVIVLDAENDSFEKHIINEKFDHILLGGFLEHLKAPDKFLCRIKPFLKESGSIVLYVPNIAYWTVRIELLKGNFDYQPTGLLDSTHLVHFTKKTLLNMLKKSGYIITHRDSIKVPIDENQIRQTLFDMGISYYKSIIDYIKKTEGDIFIYVTEAKLPK